MNSPSQNRPDLKFGGRIREIAVSRQSGEQRKQIATRSILQLSIPTLKNTRESTDKSAIGPERKQKSETIDTASKTSVVARGEEGNKTLTRMIAFNSVLIRFCSFSFFRNQNTIYIQNTRNAIPNKKRIL